MININWEEGEKWIIFFKWTNLLARLVLDIYIDE